VKSRRSKVITAVGIGLVAALGVAGCGAAEELSAKQRVSTALSGLNDATSAAFTVSVDTTAADLAALADAEGSPISASDQKAIEKNLDSKVVLAIQAPSGKTLGDYGQAGSAASPDLTSLLGDPDALGELLKKQGAFAVSVDLAGGSVVDLRSVGGVIYARADVKHILELVGQDPGLVDSAVADLPPSLSPITQAAKGKWVSLDLVKAAQAAKDQGLLNSLPTAAPSAPASPAKVQKLIADLKTAYQQKATITTLPKSGDKGTGYRLAAPAKQVAQAISGDLIALVGQDSANRINQAIADVPDKNFALDVWVKDDKLTGVSLDLTQFLKKPVPGKKLALDVAVKVNGGEVAIPVGALAIDVKSLLSEVPSGLGGQTSGSPAGGSGNTGSASNASATVLHDRATGRCLTSGKGGRAVATRPCDGSASQVWKRVPSSSDGKVIHLVNGRTGRCLDTDGPETGHLYTLPCNDFANQDWVASNPAGAGPNQYGTYKSQAFGFYLDSNEVGNAYIMGENGGEFQQWSTGS